MCVSSTSVAALTRPPTIKSGFDVKSKPSPYFVDNILKRPSTVAKGRCQTLLRNRCLVHQSARSVTTLETLPCSAIAVP